MQKAPKVGDRVRYVGFWVSDCGGEPVTGTVMTIYDQPDSAEDEWHVEIKVDAIPSWWPYKGIDKFAPQVIDLESIN